MKKADDDTDMIEVEVTAEMSKDEVVQNILKIIQRGRYRVVLIVRRSY